MPTTAHTPSWRQSAASASVLGPGTGSACRPPPPLPSDAVAGQGALGEHHQTRPLPRRLPQPGTNHVEVAALFAEPAVHLHAGDLPGSHVHAPSLAIWSSPPTLAAAIRAARDAPGATSAYVRPAPSLHG